MRFRFPRLRRGESAAVRAALPDRGPVPICIAGFAEPWDTIAQPPSFYPAACCPVARARWKARWARDRCSCGKYHFGDGSGLMRTTDVHPDAPHAA